MCRMHKCQKTEIEALPATLVSPVITNRPGTATSLVGNKSKGRRSALCRQYIRKILLVELFRGQDIVDLHAHLGLAGEDGARFFLVEVQRYPGVGAGRQR